MNITLIWFFFLSNQTGTYCLSHLSYNCCCCLCCSLWWLLHFYKLLIYLFVRICVCLYQVEIMRLISETSFWVIHCSDYYVLLAETHCPVALMHFHRLITHQSKALKILRHAECAIFHFLYQRHPRILSVFYVCLWAWTSIYDQAHLCSFANLKLCGVKKKTR